MAVHQAEARKPAVIPRRFPATAMDQIFYLSRTLHNVDMQNRCVVTFAGQVDGERLARAVRLTLDAEPVLGCRFIKHPWRSYWERHDDLERIQLCCVVESQDLESELYKFMVKPMDPVVGPQVEARIFRSNRDTLCIKVNHMVADGEGTGDYVGLLARTYRELSSDPAYCPQPNLHGSRRQFQVLRRVGPLALIRACFRFPYRLSYRLLDWGFPLASEDFSGQAFAIRRIEPKRFASIKTYCHQHQATVNDVLLTAFYRALFEVLAPPVSVPLRVGVTVNLRRHLPSGRAEAICNLAGGFPITLSRKPGATFGDTLSEIQLTTQAAKAQQPWLGLALYLELAFLPGLWLVQRIVERRIASRVVSRLIFTNRGVIDPRQVDFGDAMVTDVSRFSPVPHPPNWMFSVLTFREAMVFTASFCDTAIDARLVERILNLFVRELPE